MGKLIIPKIVGELKVIENRAGSFSVWNGIKKGSNKIMIPCRSEAHGQDIIERIKTSKSGETLSY